MNRGELLLRWVSCFHELRAARLKAAAERLCPPPVMMNRDDPRMAPFLQAAKRLTRNLMRVGHIEELTRDRYRTVPPTIVTQSAGRHFVTGARSDALLAMRANPPRGLTVEETDSSSEAPLVWHVVGNNEDVAAAAEEAGVTITRDRGGDLLASLPPLGDVLAGAPLEGIPDRIERWCPAATVGRSRWSRTVGDPHAPGLHRTVHKPHQWYFRPSPGVPTVRLDTHERRVAAAWRLLQGTMPINYASQSRVLSVPAVGFSLPLLVDRGLILAAGRLPEWQSHCWHYFEIDPERARNVARILGAPLEVTT